MASCHGFESLGQRTDLVHFDENRVGNTGIDALLQTNLVGDEQIVADELNLFPQRLAHQAPAFPVVFGKTILDGEDRKLPHPVLVEADHFVSVAAFSIGLFEDVPAVVVKFARRDVERERHLRTGFVAGLGDRFQEQFDRFRVAFEPRRKTALVAHAGRERALVQNFFKRLKYLRRAAQASGKVLHAVRHDHKLLNVDVVVGMGAAV